MEKTKLQQLREAKGWSRARLAKESKVSVRTIESWEWKKRNPSGFRQLQKVAAALATTIENIQGPAEEIPTGWVRTADMLPPVPVRGRRTRYLATASVYGVPQVTLVEWVNDAWHGAHWEWQNDVCPWEVIAWREFPEPYK